jgi:hypothetical protein
VEQSVCQVDVLAEVDDLLDALEPGVLEPDGAKWALAVA